MLTGEKRRDRLRINQQHVFSPDILNPAFARLLIILLIDSFCAFWHPVFHFPKYLFIFLYFLNFDYFM